MTGPECYKEALRLLEPGEHDEREPDLVDRDTARAQVFATLALAAATALGRESEGRTMPSMDRAAWFDAAAECRKQVSA